MLCGSCPLLVTQACNEAQVQTKSSIGGSMSAMLDAMQQLMSGGGSFFDPDFLHDLAHCWDDTHPNLTQANDNAWKGMMEFFENDGYGNDSWGGCCNDLWNEDNATAQGPDLLELQF